MPEQQTRLLAERYELITPIGRGTMGTVWRAHDRSLGREVAVKEIRQEPGLSEEQRAELRERMLREGRTAARINHPSVATVYDAIEDGGRPWIIMELVEGRSLEQVIDEEGPLPPRLVAEIGSDLLGALRLAHSQGILHRDVKPGNVLLTETGRVVLTDFGIAKAAGDANLTKTGMVIGSPGYTAPERARGEYTGPESDLWSLGATLYFAVEGRPAYERRTVAETLAALMTESADPPTQAGPLRPLLEALLEKDHTRRLPPSKAAAMLRAIADTPSSEEVDLDALSAPSQPTPPAAPAMIQALAAERAAPPPPPAPAEPARPASRPAAPPQQAGPPRPAAPAQPAPMMAAPTPAPSGPPPATGEPEGEQFDPDQTMMVIRPKGGMNLTPPAPTPTPPSPSGGPAGPQSGEPGAPQHHTPGEPYAPAAPAAPVAGLPAAAMPPAHPSAGEPAEPPGGAAGPTASYPARPGVSTSGPPFPPPINPPQQSAPYPQPQAAPGYGPPPGQYPAGGPGVPFTAPHGQEASYPGIPVAGTPGSGQPPAPGGPGAPAPGQQGPQPPDGFHDGPGLGTDLFSIAGMPQQQPAAKEGGGRALMIILVGLAIIAMAVIAILVISALSG